MQEEAAHHFRNGEGPEVDLADIGATPGVWGRWLSHVCQFPSLLSSCTPPGPNAWCSGGAHFSPLWHVGNYSVCLGESKDKGQNGSPL